MLKLATSILHRCFAVDAFLHSHSQHFKLCELPPSQRLLDLSHFWLLREKLCKVSRHQFRGQYKLCLSDFPGMEARSVGIHQTLTEQILICSLVIRNAKLRKFPQTLFCNPVAFNGTLKLWRCCRNAFGILPITIHNVLHGIGAMRNCRNDER